MHTHNTLWARSSSSSAEFMRHVTLREGILIHTFLAHQLSSWSTLTWSECVCATNACVGLEWVAVNHKGPSVVIMSLGVSLGAWSAAIENAVRSLVNEQGITVVVASGKFFFTVTV